MSFLGEQVHKMNGRSGSANNFSFEGANKATPRGPGADPKTIAGVGYQKFGWARSGLIHIKKIKEKRFIWEKNIISFGGGFQPTPSQAWIRP